MKDIIHLLPDAVANQIAAGEVIQRPASVVKELVENAIDAGADRIDVSVIDAGKTAIQVIDNGKGMSHTDARLSFERHATSKISQASDLFNLHTMGFRGEALASIAAVAQVNLRTRSHNDDIGTEINVAASKVISQEATSCPPGSNFLVKNLFFNVPARRKFLKANTTELNNIIAAFEKIVLVYPDITFTLHSNDTSIYHLPAGSLHQRILDVSGKKSDQYLLPVNVKTTLARITGYVGKPESAKKKTTNEFFFVNGRYMRHPFFHKAVMTAYDRLIPNGEHIPYYIYLDVDPNDIDVNIHPSKAEIKFDNEHSIWQILLAGVREALGTFCQIPQLEFSQEPQLEIPTYHPENTNRLVSQQNTESKVEGMMAFHKMAINRSSGLQNTEIGKESFRLTNPSQHTAQHIANPTQHITNPAQPAPSQELLPMESLSDMPEIAPTHYQYKGCYIMTAIKSGLMVVNQHRAHVRILFEELMKRKHDMTTQKVLFPEMIELNTSESLLFNRIKNEIEEIGFCISDMGGGSYSVVGIPAILKDVDALTLLRDILANAAQTAGNDDKCNVKDNLLFNICLTVARSAAVANGQKLQNNEMESIINRLFTCDNPNYTPDGKPILRVIKDADIDF